MLFENFRRNERKAVSSCSHLVDQPEKQQETLERTDFDAMLSDYDRILLRFGMHIFCES